MAQAPNEYLRNAVMTASQEQLQLMLYDGAIRFTRQGIRGVETQQYDMAYEGYSRAQAIVLEMQNSLNYEVDEQLCKRMAGLYNFIYRRLVDASTRRDLTAAQDALRILEFQRETWVMLIDKLKEERDQDGNSNADGSASPSIDVSDQEPVDLEQSTYGSLSVEG